MFYLFLLHYLICNTHFNRKNYIDNPSELCCPHCGKSLVLKKNRKLFNIHKCVNPNCSYLVNCGMSTRATSRVMREVHGVKISHTQIANYATTASYCIKPFVDSYDYKPSNYLAADET